MTTPVMSTLPVLLKDMVKVRVSPGAAAVALTSGKV
jgi:hypothetical protein